MSQQQVMVVLGANIANFQSAMGQVQHSMQQTASAVQRSMNGASSSASSGAGGIKSALGGIAGVVAGAFAVDKILGFGKTLLDTTADLQAQQGQYDQVMGGMKDSTDKYLSEMGNKWGKHPNELKKSYMQYVAILKSKGMAEGDAHATAKKYLSATVDANAFANEDMESTTARFMGGIKGEYDSLDTAMVNLSATMLNDKAQKEYGKKFDELTVAQQETLKTQEMLRQHTSAGVVGQGTREAGSYANTLANLKNTWAELLSKFGSPVLEAVNGKLKGLTDVVKNIDVKAVMGGFSAFGGYMRDVFAPTFEDVKNGLQLLWDKFKDSGGLETAKGLFEGIKDALGFLRQHAEIVTGVLGGLVGAFIAFNILTGISTAIGVFKNALALLRAGTLLSTIAQWALNTAMLANPFVWIAILIGALIAVVIILWKNWDKVSKWLHKSWDALKSKASEVWNGMKTAMSNAWNAIKSKVSEVWNGVKSYLAGLWDGIKSKASSVFNGIKSFLAGVWDGIKAKASGVWNGIKSAISGVWDSIKTAISNKISSIKTTISGLWTKASEIAGKIRSGFSNLFGGIKLPHFSISGSLNPKDWLKGGLPKLGVSWYAKGGIFKGTNGGSLIGVGENGGDEAVLPLSNKTRMKPFAVAVADMMPKQQNGQVVASGGVYTFTVPVYLDGREIAKGTAKYTQEELDKISKRNNRMGGTV